jgi:hypothetical protein
MIFESGQSSSVSFDLAFRFHDVVTRFVAEVPLPPQDEPLDHWLKTITER